MAWLLGGSVRGCGQVRGWVDGRAGGRVDGYVGQQVGAVVGVPPGWVGWLKSGSAALDSGIFAAMHVLLQQKQNLLQMYC